MVDGDSNFMQFHYRLILHQRPSRDLKTRRSGPNPSVPRVRTGHGSRVSTGGVVRVRVVKTRKSRPNPYWDPHGSGWEGQGAVQVGQVGWA
jgi:hypothetical protein